MIHIYTDLQVLADFSRDGKKFEKATAILNGYET